MAAGSETWHPGNSFKYLPKAVCCAGTMATGAASSASAAAGSAATLTKALGERAVETSSKAASGPGSLDEAPTMILHDTHNASGQKRVFLSEIAFTIHEPGTVAFRPRPRGGL